MRLFKKGGTCATRVNYGPDITDELAALSLKERTARRQKAAREALGTDWVGHPQSTFTYARA